MAENTALDILKLLADDTRWQLLRALRSSDYQAGELVERLGQPQNLVSYHLGLLRQAGLVQTHRSEADARVLYYGLDTTAVQSALAHIGADLQLVSARLPSAAPNELVVFLCTANSARSQMAEGWLRTLSQGRTPVRSAGTQPATLHPLAVEVMAEVGIDIGYQQAKDVAALAGLAPAVVVTVCDRAREECATKLEAPQVYHWSIPDPVRAPVNEQETVFRAVRDQLRTRVEGLLSMRPQPAS